MHKIITFVNTVIVLFLLFMWVESYREGSDSLDILVEENNKLALSNAELTNRMVSIERQLVRITKNITSADYATHTPAKKSIDIVRYDSADKKDLSESPEAENVGDEISYYEDTNIDVYYEHSSGDECRGTGKSAIELFASIYAKCPHFNIGDGIAIDK